MRKALFLAFLICVFLVFFAVTFNFFVKGEPLFLLRGVRISGCSLVSENEIMALIAPHIDTSILNVEIEKIRKALIGHPCVKNVKVKRVYPFYLHIEIEERNPAALWVRPDGSLKVVDEDGYAFRDIRKNEKARLFLIHADKEKDLKEALLMIRKWISEGVATHDFLSQILFVDGNITILTNENVQIILGKEDFEKRLKKAKKVLEDAKKRGILVKLIDARFEKGAIVREREG